MITDILLRVGRECISAKDWLTAVNLCLHLFARVLTGAKQRPHGMTTGSNSV